MSLYLFLACSFLSGHLKCLRVLQLPCVWVINLTPYGNHSYKEDLRNLLMTAYVVAFVWGNRETRRQGQWVHFFTYLWASTGSNTARWTCLASEGVGPGIEHNTRTKCRGWEVQVEVAELAKAKSLQLFQEHFYFCAIVHFFWHKKY